MAAEDSDERYVRERGGVDKERCAVSDNRQADKGQTEYSRLSGSEKQILQTHQVITVVLPDADGTHVHHIRAATEPDAAQKEIYEKPVSFSQGDHPF